MKRIFILLGLIIGLSITANSQVKGNFIFKQYSSELSFVVMDSIHGAQSMVIEYPKFLVIVEMPLIDEGGSKTHDLNEDTLGAYNFIDFLSRKFPKKPIKFILSSHWHQHSLSGVTPFTRNGTKIVTTKQNWDYALANGLIESRYLKSVKSNIIEVSKDTLLLANSEFPIKVLYLDSTYSNKPTKDYLFFYLTKQAYLHASCMAAYGNQELLKKGNYVYHERLVDLYRLINEKQLKVDKLIRLSREDYKNGQFEPGIYDYSGVEIFIKNGKSPAEIMQPFVNLSIAEIQSHRDSILTEMIKNEIPHFAINKAVYECIKKKEFEKALLFAQILNIHSPGYLTFIDSMGEAFFVNDNLIAAKHISEILFQRDPHWQGGIKTWEDNKKNNTY